jgi:hypothetical protein
MAGLGRKTFSPGDVLTSSDVQGYLMDQSVMVFAGTAARASAIPSPSAGMVAYSTATQLQVYNGSAWVDLSTGYGSATGGASSTAISVGGTAYTLLTFTSTATLTVTKSGLFDVLAFGGGGAGGVIANGANNFYGGGGGAGGVQQSTIYIDANQTITIGAGGSGATASLQSSSGLSSTVGTLLTAVGGGYGSFVDATGGDRSGPSSGGSGGGAGRYLTRTGGSGFQGFAGGTNDGTTPLGNGGGGGGAAAVGGNGSIATGGAGGTAQQVNTFIAGASLFKGGGGGGAGGTTGGAGGSSVGGAGYSGTSGAGTAAAANTGSGGGGAGDNGTAQRAGGNGGSGIVYIRFKV